MTVEKGKVVAESEEQKLTISNTQDPELTNTAAQGNKIILVNPAPGTEEEEEDPETPYLASDMYKRVVTLINKFEEDLPDDLQAGGRLVSAGNITFSIQDVGYWDPNMIVFYGELEDGSRVELVQHLSQLNLLLVAVKRSNPEEPRRIIGFTTNAEPDVEDVSEET